MSPKTLLEIYFDSKFALAIVLLYRNINLLAIDFAFQLRLRTD